MMLTSAAAEQVGLAAQIDQRRQPGAPIATPTGAAPPGPAEAVDDDHRRSPRRSAAASRARIAAALPSGSTGSSSARCTPSCRRHVRLIDAGIRHDEAQPVLHDQHVGPRAHHAHRFRQHHLDQARILAHLCRQRDGSRRWRHGREIDAAAFRLGDDLLRQRPRRRRRAAAGRRRANRRRRREQARSSPGAPSEAGDRQISSAVVIGSSIGVPDSSAETFAAASATPARHRASGTAPGPGPGAWNTR